MSLPSNPADDIQQCIDYYENAPVDHFNKSENSDFISSYSELAGAISDAMTVCTNSLKDDGEDIRHVEEDINQGRVEMPHQADGDHFDVLNNQGRDRDYQFNCEILEGGYRCGYSISYNSSQRHVAQFHNIPKSRKVFCPWAWCGKPSYRRNLDRHIKTKHLGFKRLLGPPC
ncbi:hypothetical protein SCLCIDRAFT_279632 [Scleroderma citrinum Foug A]|uniref:Uncharacterized protein n=1 Tax=Scleroderma citrinum Foug A TaxID=1036808 RepID=A0A0C3DIS6_9AGAM|nr:hypothetical protein SCLCIDRAFT_279632 [Scleroderma citrinum Foug A]